MHQSDTKRILAYSTISHCGFLMVVAINGVLEYALIYLYVHGFFKSAVFMSCGNINRLNGGVQDFKKMGCFFRYLPFEFFSTVIGLLNLSGLPFSLGFFIKHLFFLVLDFSSFFFYFFFVNLFFAALTGLFYSYRLLVYVFFEFKKSRSIVYVFDYGNMVFSIYYSNVTIASTGAVCLIYVFSYFFSGYLFLIYFSELFLFGDFFNNNFVNIIYFLKSSSFFLYFNFFFVNLLILFFIFFLINVK